MLQNLIASYNSQMNALQEIAYANVLYDTFVKILSVYGATICQH